MSAPTESHAYKHKEYSKSCCIINQDAASADRQPHLLLCSYFHSGWVFFIPYLAAYLLYAGLKWPVNPGTSSQQLAVSNLVWWLPCLLHVYWFLHGLNLILAAIALHTWWRTIALSDRLPRQSSDKGGAVTPQIVGQRLYAILPWLCLAMVFWIPGVYLEFPSDPWEHYERINAWSLYEFHYDYGFWTKSSYFFAYSLVGHTTLRLRQLEWLDF